MKSIFKIIFVFIISIFSYQLVTAYQKLLIIDTEGNQAYYYRNTIESAQIAGFDVTFLNLYDVLENNNYEECKNIIVFLSPYFFKNLNHPINARITTMLRKIAQQQDAFVGFLLPSFQYSDQLYNLLLGAIKSILNLNAVQSSDLPSNTIKNFLRFILQHDNAFGSLFGATLANVEAGKFTSFEDTIHDATIMSINLFPKCRNLSPTTLNIFPAGMCIHNEATHNILFLSKASFFNFADITENFWKTPINLHQRNEQLCVAQYMLKDIASMLTKIPHPCQCTLPAYSNPAGVEKNKATKHTQACKQLQKNHAYDWICHKGIVAGLFEITDFFLEGDEEKLNAIAQDDPQKAIQLKTEGFDRGINFIYDAGFNLLWFELNPESNLSEQAIWRANKKEYMRKIKTIIAAIRKKFVAEKKEMPKIFIGSDITTNFSKNPVPCAAVDAYGSVYSKIPCPLNIEQFWKKELLSSFDIFFELFENKIPIDGVFLDFEMYHAQDQAGSYTNLMDFSDYSWHLFCKAHNAPQALKTTAQRIQYLAQTKQFKIYFKFLENKACEIGRLIAKHLRNKKTNLLIGAYAPTLPNSWFYRGIYRGLSNQEWPLILATFNVDYYSHYQWFMEHDIHIFHGFPILLSKLTQSSDFSLIPHALQYHDFIWFNRPSRHSYKDIKNRSWSIEASPIEPSILGQEIKKAYSEMES